MLKKKLFRVFGTSLLGGNVLAFMQRWPLCRGGLYAEVAFMQRWPLCRGGLCGEVVVYTNCSLTWDLGCLAVI